MPSWAPIAVDEQVLIDTLDVESGVPPRLLAPVRTAADSLTPF
jgi:hypothetical protein